jgi:hypothetical protein
MKMWKDNKIIHESDEKGKKKETKVRVGRHEGAGVKACTRK